MTRDLDEVFADLHEAADALVERLVRTYDATARRATDDEVSRFRQTVSRATTVTPAVVDASPAVVAWTRMKSCPVVLVEAGNRISAVLPACPCDACDTDLAEAVGELERLLSGIVCGFIERVERVGLGRRIKVSHQMRGSGGASMHTLREAMELGISARAGTQVWAPWSLRSGVAGTMWC